VAGVASYTDIYRYILHSIAGYLDTPDPDVQVSAMLDCCFHLFVCSVFLC